MSETLVLPAAKTGLPRLQWPVMNGDEGQVAQASEQAARSTGTAVLVGRIEAGDPKAEEELVARYGRPVKLLLQRHTGGRPEAEDLFQDTFALALAKLRRGELRQPSRLPGYLASIARSLAIEGYRKHARRKTDADSETVDTRARVAADQLGELLSSETAALVRHLLAELDNERDRQVLFRFYVAEEDRGAIAADLGLDSLQFNRVLYRARQRYKVIYLAHLQSGSSRTPSMLGVATLLFLAMQATGELSR